MWSAFLAIAYKEFLHLSRDKMALMFTLLMQSVDFFTLGFIDTTLHHAPTVIVDQDRSVESDELLERISSTNTFEVKYVTSSIEQARGHIRAGRAKVAIVIPPDYRRMRRTGGHAKLLTLVDGSETFTSNQAVAAIDGLTARITAETVQERLKDNAGYINMNSFVLFNPNGDTARFMLPALVAMLMGRYLRMCATSLLREKGGGNLERLLMTPMNYTGLILGKIAPIAVLAAGNGLLYIAAMRWIMGVPIRGATFVVIAGVVLYTMTLLSLGMLIAAGSPSAGSASLRIQIIGFLTVTLSGYFLPIEAFPIWLQPVSHALPASHMIAIMRGTVIRGANFFDLLPHFAYFIVLPPIFLVIAGRRFARTVID
jgi:ABC-2 type transport system permease protein